VAAGDVSGGPDGVQLLEPGVEIDLDDRFGGGRLTAEALYDGSRQQNKKHCPFKNFGDHKLLLSF